MAVEERRRIALHRAAAESWGEEIADTLVELVAPSGHELATRQDLDEFRAAVDARFSVLEERLSAMDLRWEDRLAAMDGRLSALEERWEERLSSMEERWEDRLSAMDERWDVRMRGMEHRITTAFERRIADSVSLQTRTLVFSQLGALVVIAALAFGLR